MAEKNVHIVSAGGALETLVHQFADPLSFYRELIQNALDAGSRVIEVDVTFQEPATAVISVEDTGSGMTAQIIDSQLTCLFSSEKDDDLTRIGKFGIGFVSVFAVGPDRVVLETARDGEGWRVEFLNDGSFTRSPLEQTREGTRIELFKSATPEQFEELRRRSRETLTFWCKHVDGEILFGGERVDRPLGVEATSPLLWEEPDTSIVLGYPADFKSFIGFYNQGLTLLESTTTHTFEGLAVKASSRFLEHTLTRDNVVEDDNFAKVMRRIEAMISEELPDHLFRELEQTDKERAPLCRALMAHFGWQTLRSYCSEELSHKDGQQDGEDWLVLPEVHQAGTVSFGPYTREFEPGEYEAVFQLRVPPDSYTEAGTEVCDLRVYILESDNTLARRILTWADFHPHRGYQQFVLKFSTQSNEQLEFTTHWPGHVALRQRAVSVRRLARHPRKWTASQLVSGIFRSSQGASLSLEQCRKALRASKLLTAPAQSALTEALEKADFTVVKAPPDGAEEELLEALLEQRPPRALEEYALPLPTEIHRAEVTLLREKTRLLAGAWGGELADLRGVVPGCEQDWSALLVSTPGQLERLEEVLLPAAGLFSKGKQVLVVNVEHPQILRILTLAKSEPQLAAYLLVKQFFRQRGLTPELDSELALRAWSHS